MEPWQYIEEDSTVIYNNETYREDVYMAFSNKRELRVPITRDIRSIRRKMTNVWNNTAASRIRFTNMNERVLTPTWNLGSTSKKKEDNTIIYNNETYREDVYMAFSNKLGSNSTYKTEEILQGIEKAGIQPREIVGLQRRPNGVEIMSNNERSYEILLDQGIKIGENQEVIQFRAKRKRSQAVKVFGLGMDIYDAVLEEALS